jgi:hypothetical protein
MIIARFKSATGLSDLKLAELLGIARSTVQAGLSGKLRLKLDDDARARLAAVVAERRAMLDELARELAL